MPRKKKRPADLNRLAKSIVDDATSDEPEPDAEPRGRAGGLVGGNARAERLTPEQAEKAPVKLPEPAGK